MRPTNSNALQLTNEQRLEILEEISNNWKLEAKQEDSFRYFYHVKEAKQVLSGEKYYVIGRKGSGKSAISQYLLNLSNDAKDGYKTFTETLSFKNFPFNELYALQNNKYTQPNQYMTIWKYIIYSYICRLMIKNQSIDNNLREVLEKLYPPTNTHNLSRLIETWTTKEFGAQIAGTGGSISVEKISKFDNLSWIEKTNILEDIIEQYIDNSKYYIIFDELDEDYRDFKTEEERCRYVYLITSLFKAVQDIKAIFKEKKQVICPIVFLRDDIYLLIQDPDKNKWGDFIILLEWDKDKIKSMLAYRISKAIDAEGEILQFNTAWDSIFCKEDVHYGTSAKKSISIFEYMTLSTQLRPRDYIKYIQVCAEEAINSNEPQITAQIVKKMDKGFSNYLKAEIIDEISAQLPDIINILSIISQIRKWNFSIKEFKGTYMQYYKRNTVKEGNIDKVLQLLFDFSVIGNQPNNRQISFFRYKNPEARFNFQENIVVHRGLFKALQIL